MATTLDYLRHNAVEFERIEVRECVRIDVALHALMTVNSLHMRENWTRTVRKDMRAALAKSMHELGVLFAFHNLFRSQVDSIMKLFRARDELLNPLCSVSTYFGIPEGRCCFEAKPVFLLTRTREPIEKTFPKKSPSWRIRPAAEPLSHLLRLPLHRP